jgi:hypothetical protein
MICFYNKSLNKLVYLPQFLTYNQSKYIWINVERNEKIAKLHANLSLCAEIIHDDLTKLPSSIPLQVKPETLAY